jgi:Ankyrin repeats (3 copies)
MMDGGSHRIEVTPEARALLWMGCGGVRRASVVAQKAVKAWSNNPLPAERDRVRRLVRRAALAMGGRGSMKMERGTAFQRLVDCSDVVGVVAGFVGYEGNAMAILCMGACVGEMSAVRVVWSGVRLGSAAWEGRSAVAWAAVGGYVSMVSELLEMRGGRDVDSLWGSVYEASRVGAVDVLGVLLGAGADVEDACGDEEDRALTVAAFGGHGRVVEALVGAGADVEAVNKNGKTALLLAACKGHATVVGALLGAGADVNAARGSGWTAMMAAAQDGHASVVEALVGAGADVNARTRTGTRR